MQRVLLEKLGKKNNLHSLVLWAVMELLLLVIRSHKQTLHTKDDVKREGEARDDTASCARESRVQAGFSDNRHPGWSFPEALLAASGL